MKFDYNKYVKQNLIQWREEFEKRNRVKLNYTAIAEAMDTDFNIATSTQKVAAMFNEESTREIKLQELIALAQIFDISIWDLCQYPNHPDAGIDKYKLFRKEKGSDGPVHELRNRYYLTEQEGQCYYCYYFRPKHFQNHLKPVDTSAIEEAIMTIGIKDGHTVVTLKERRTLTAFYGDEMPSFELSGTLHHFENRNMAYSFISDSTGRRAMALMFKFLNLSADVRYYMTVGMLTFSWNPTHEPLFQKMAVFRVQQDYQEEKTAEMLRGILALNSSPIIIDEEALEALKADEDMSKLLSEGRSATKCYIYNEATLRDSYLIPDDKKRVEMLFRLRRNSLCPAHEVITEPESYVYYIKQHQIAQLRERQKEPASE